MVNRSRVLSIGFALSLVNCLGYATSRTAGGPGGPGYRSIECKGSHQACIDRAAQECPQGYELATSGGQTDVYGGYKTPASSTYTGHMLIRCNKGPTSDETVVTVTWRRVQSSGCTFEIPDNWIEEKVEGTLVFHAPGWFDPQVAAEATPFAGTLDAYAAQNFGDQQVQATEIEIGPVLMATKDDTANKMHVTTVIARRAGKVYELRCAAGLGAKGSTCRHVLRSLAFAE